MNPVALLAIAFVCVPVLEIWLLIQVGSVIGAGWTVSLVLLTAVLGAALLRQQGLATLARARRTLDEGGLPAMEMLEGVALVVGGALLLTPGFVTDGIGFLCLLPPVRQALAGAVLARLRVRGGGPPDQRGPRTLEGDFTRED